MRVLLCAGCGAPLDAPWHDLAVVCAWCGDPNLPEGPLALRVPADGRPRLNLGGRTWVLEARLAEGDSSTVYRARWVARLGELGVVKVLTALGDADLFRREWEALRALHRSTAPGAAHLRSRLPAPIATGLIEADRPRPAAVFGWKSGFVHTLAQVAEAHPAGVPGPVLVWILKRLLELLGFVHASGLTHGAVVPDHVLIHPRDHGAILVGWTLATPPGQRLPAVAARWEPFWGGQRVASPALDIAMACRCAHQVAGWHLPGAARTPAIDAVLQRGLSGRAHDALALAQELTQASARDLGPPAYHPLPMPGWTRHPGVFARPPGPA